MSQETNKLREGMFQETRPTLRSLTSGWRNTEKPILTQVQDDVGWRDHGRLPGGREEAQ